SAPDHHHFQGTTRGRMPLENDVDRLLDAKDTETLEYLTSIQDAELYHYRKFTTGIYVLRGRNVKSVGRLFYRLLDCAPTVEGDREPRFNLYTYCKSGEYRCIVIFRTQHRSHHYFSDGPDHLTMSPGCVDMAGLFIVPVREDYEKLDAKLLSDMLAEVSIPEETDAAISRRMTRGQRLVSVGIMSAKEIVFEIRSDGAGSRKAVWKEGKIEYDGALYDELYFDERPLASMFAEPTFILHGVTIGKGFHWQRTETQRFAGALKIIVEGDELTAINVIGVEDYLLSVISSEMNAAASLEFLKAHAVISRSWIMAQMEGREESGEDVSRKVEVVDGETRITCWYGRAQHSRYDVCADDHCQRYQGVQRAVGRNVRLAIDATWGEVLTYDGKICDARFSKCCGGMMEKFSTCWEDRDLPYLQAIPDTPDHAPLGESPSDRAIPAVRMSYSVLRDRLLDDFVDRLPEDDTGESDSGGVAANCGSDGGGEKSGTGAGARPFCDTTDGAVLSQVLNDYDLETADFYRWSVVYERKEISALISKNVGIDIGTLTVLEPLEIGPSGRIWKLRIRGDKATVVVGKELEIRKVLSTSHLKSSAFTPIYLDVEGNPVEASARWSEIMLRGKGWGHGVGLCQIGAAVMASKGYDYREILQHYYPDTGLCR
ncbi:MAG: SpoIID/LytB domain-containing protein, partial [Bacteroidales bacterium]|nr:SpoIID/LytB domain-containing protein [Bacteroidales bacterium]